MLNQYSRTELIFGKEAMEKLWRSGVGALDLIDDDRICLTNINRQLCATRKTVPGKRFMTR